jgi:hypothetical protein
MPGVQLLDGQAFETSELPAGDAVPLAVVPAAP